MVSALETRRRALMFQPHEDVASGAIASFVTDVLSPLPLEFDLEPIQSGTGDPSPDNIRPITGHDGFTTYNDPKHGGLIRWNQMANNSLAPSNRNSLTITGATDYFTVNGTADATAEATGWFGMTQDVVKPLAGHVFFISHKLIDGTVSDNDSVMFNVRISTDGQAYLGQETICAIPSDATDYSKRSRWRFIQGTVFTNAKIRVQVMDLTEMFGAGNEPSTVAEFRALFPLDYYAYNSGETTCVSAVSNLPYTKRETEFDTPPGTVYGGHVKDNGDGTYDLTVDRYEYTFTGNENFLTNTSAWGEYAFLYNTGVQIQSSITSKSLCKSSHFVLTNSGGWSSLAPGKYMTAGSVYIGLGFDGTKDELKEWLASQASNNTPLQVVCGLATPIQYTGLSLTALQSLIGQNHVWVDNADSVSVEYWGH